MYEQTFKQQAALHQEVWLYFLNRDCVGSKLPHLQNSSSSTKAMEGRGLQKLTDYIPSVFISKSTLQITNTFIHVDLTKHEHLEHVHAQNLSYFYPPITHNSKMCIFYVHSKQLKGYWRFFFSFEAVCEVQHASYSHKTISLHIRWFHSHLFGFQVCIPSVTKYSTDQMQGIKRTRSNRIHSNSKRVCLQC